MDNILTFTGFKTDHSLYDEEAQRALEALPVELRDRVREAMESATIKYINELRKPIDIQIPGNSSEQQEHSIRDAIEKQQCLCRSLIHDLAMAKAELAIRDYENS